ncbi:MAG: CDP-alcohol phosphatidyltransferase family protein [Actinomycetota bacterium]
MSLQAPQEIGVLTRRFTIPNLITSLRIALIPVFAFIFLSGRADRTAFVLLAVIGASDWIDGFVARRTGQVSVLGKLLDPVADRAAIMTVLLVLAFRGAIWWPLAAAILLRDLLVTIVFVVLESKGFPRLPVNRTGKAATFAIFAGMGLAVFSLAFSTPFEKQVEAASLALLAMGAAMYWVAGALYLTELKRTETVNVTDS